MGDCHMVFVRNDVKRWMEEKADGHRKRFASAKQPVLYAKALASPCEGPHVIAAETQTIAVMPAFDFPRFVSHKPRAMRTRLMSPVEGAGREALTETGDFNRVVSGS